MCFDHVDTPPGSDVCSLNNYIRYYYTSLLFSQILYLISNSRDFIKSTDVFIQILAECLVTIKVLVVIANRDSIKLLLETLQAECDMGKLKIYKHLGEDEVSIPKSPPN